MAVICDKCGIRSATHQDSGADGWFLNYCDECDQPKPHGVVSAYRDAEGWVLSDAHGDPVNWPGGWPSVIDADFLRARGVIVVEG
jgi:hypothetical protein